MDQNSKSKLQKLFVDNHYKDFLEDCRETIAKTYAGFWEGFTHQEQLMWLDKVIIDSKRLGFGNRFLIQNYLTIVCKLGRNFIQDATVDDNLIRFITDSNFSPYVRLRDANRWIDKHASKVTLPEKVT